MLSYYFSICLFFIHISLFSMCSSFVCKCYSSYASSCFIACSQYLFCLNYYIEFIFFIYIELIFLRKFNENFLTRITFLNINGIIIKLYKK